MEFQITSELFKTVFPF